MSFVPLPNSHSHSASKGSEVNSGSQSCEWNDILAKSWQCEVSKERAARCNFSWTFLQNKGRIYLIDTSWNWDSKVVNWMLEVGIAITTAQDMFTQLRKYFEITGGSAGSRTSCCSTFVAKLYDRRRQHCRYTSTKIFLPRPNSQMAPVLSTNLENPLIFDQEDKL